MPRSHVLAMAAVLLTVGAGVALYRPSLRAETGVLPSAVTAGSCWELTRAREGMTFRVDAVEGRWIRTAAAGHVTANAGMWINVDTGELLDATRPCP